MDDPSLTEEETINITEDDVIITDDSDVSAAVSSIKKEKPDVPATAVEKSADENVDEKKAESTEQAAEQMNEDEDSDVEEVQLIEEPIEEIIIPDDANDLDEPNLETLVEASIVTAEPSEAEEKASAETAVEEPVIEKVVDITQSVSTVSIDGNVEPGESIQQVITAPTRIKINMTRSNGTVKSPLASPKNDEPKTVEKPETVNIGFSESANEEPPPPGEEMITLVAADIKPRIRERKLTEYPPVMKSVETSALCSIM